MESIINYLIHTFSFSKIQAGLAFLIGIIAGLLGGYTVIIHGLLVALGFDFFLGFLKAIFLEKNFSGKKFLFGFGKIIAYCMAIMVLNNTDSILGLTGFGFTEFGAIYLGIRESISCLKHLKKFGVPIPDVLIKQLEDYKTKIESKTI